MGRSLSMLYAPFHSVVFLDFFGSIKTIVAVQAKRSYLLFYLLERSLTMAFYCRHLLSDRVRILRDLKQATTAAAAETSLNKRFDEQYNSFARALLICVHLFAVLCKRTTWNGKMLRYYENANHKCELLKFLLRTLTFLTDERKTLF